MLDGLYIMYIPTIEMEYLFLGVNIHLNITTSYLNDFLVILFRLAIRAVKYSVDLVLSCELNTRPRKSKTRLSTLIITK